VSAIATPAERFGDRKFEVERGRLVRGGRRYCAVAPAFGSGGHLVLRFMKKKKDEMDAVRRVGDGSERTKFSFRVMSVRRAGPWVSEGSEEEVERRAGRKKALPGRKDIVVVRWKTYDVAPTWLYL
jgi:hypothetical protein